MKFNQEVDYITSASTFESLVEVKLKSWSEDLRASLIVLRVPTISLACFQSFGMAMTALSAQTDG